MKKITLLFLSNIISAFVFAQSFTATYSFDSVKTTSGLIDPTPLPIATGIVFGAFNAKGAPTNPNSTARFSYTGWSTGAATGNNNYSALTGTVDTAEYYSVTIAPAIGHTISLNDIAFKTQRSGTGIRTFFVRSSVDNYTSNLAATINPVNANLSVQTGDVFFWNYDSKISGQNGSKIMLPTGYITNSSSSVTFRFYAWNSEAPSGTFSIDDVVINGSASVAAGLTETTKDKFIAFPNPSSTGIFTIDINASTNAKVFIYDVVGKLILAKELDAQNQQLNLSDYPNGSYFISINSNAEVRNEKIIINK